MNSYAQNGEDIIIQKYFGNYIGKFLSIGENDGITFSNVRAFAEMGWTGLLVEASPTAYERMLKNYELIDRDFDFQNVAIGKDDGVLEFYESGELLGKGDVSLVSSGVRSELDRWTSLNIPFHKIKVPMTSFATMLARSRHTYFDLLSLDIEGMELDVLPQIDFKALGIKVAVIEWNSQNEKAYNDIMFPRGFKLVHKNLENLIYSL